MIVDFPSILLMSIFGAAAILAIYAKIGLRRIVRFGAVADLGGSFLLALFMGMSTVAIFTAVLAGLWLSIALSIIGVYYRMERDSSAKFQYRR